MHIFRVQYILKQKKQFLMYIFAHQQSNVISYLLATSTYEWMKKIKIVWNRRHHIREKERNRKMTPLKTNDYSVICISIQIIFCIMHIAFRYTLHQWRREICMCPPSKYQANWHWIGKLIAQWVGFLIELAGRSNTLIIIYFIRSMDLIGTGARYMTS